MRSKATRGLGGFKREIERVRWRERNLNNIVSDEKVRRRRSRSVPEYFGTALPTSAKFLAFTINGELSITTPAGLLLILESTARLVDSFSDVLGVFVGGGVGGERGSCQVETACLNYNVVALIMTTMLRYTLILSRTQQLSH